MTAVRILGLAFLSTTMACLDPAPRPRLGAETVDTCSGVADGALCNDQNSCTLADHCLGGICVGTVAIDGTACTDGNQCTSGDVCSQGQCLGTAVADGVPCTDGEPCTEPDTCRLGRCLAGPPRVCDDGNACTVDQCVLGMGCQFDVTPACPDGSVSDAASDADATGQLDATIDGDASDGGSTIDADGGGAVDVNDDRGGPDVPITDGGIDSQDAADANDVAGDRGSVDAGQDLQPDSQPDAQSDVQPDGQQDAPQDGPEDAVDAARPDNMVIPFEARGGACVCGVAAAPQPPAALTGLALAGLLLTIRRRRR